MSIVLSIARVHSYTLATLSIRHIPQGHTSRIIDCTIYMLLSFKIVIVHRTLNTF